MAGETHETPHYDWDSVPAPSQYAITQYTHPEIANIEVAMEEGGESYRVNQLVINKLDDSQYGRIVALGQVGITPVAKVVTADGKFITRKLDTWKVVNPTSSSKSNTLDDMTQEEGGKARDLLQ